jgi:SAM-dependent methyltransferase
LYFKKYFPHQIPLLQFLLFADSLPQFIYKKLHDRTINLLRKELVDCESILDLGCGANSPVQYINAAYTLGVDNDQESLEESDKNTIHTEYLKADIMKLEYGEKSFDAVLILDVLQYLDKGEGQAIISRAQIWAKKRLIVTVPNNYRYADEVKSVWRVRDLTKLRLKVYGLAGLRVLHGRWGSIKYIPRVFWKAVSFASQPIIYRLPQLAFLLGAVYRAGRNNDGR